MIYYKDVKHILYMMFVIYKNNNILINYLILYVKQVMMKNQYKIERYIILLLHINNKLNNSINQLNFKDYLKNLLQELLLIIIVFYSIQKEH